MPSCERNFCLRNCAAPLAAAPAAAALRSVASSCNHGVRPPQAPLHHQDRRGAADRAAAPRHVQRRARQPLAAGDAAPRLCRRLPLRRDARRLLRRRVELLRLQDAVAHGRRRRVRRLRGGVHQSMPARDLLLILHPLQGAPRVLPDRHDGAVGDARERRARRDVVRLVANHVRDLRHLHHVDRARPAAFRRSDARLDAGLLAGG